MIDNMTSQSVSNLIINAADMLYNLNALKDILNQHSFYMHNMVFQTISEDHKTITPLHILHFYQRTCKHIQEKDTQLFVAIHSTNGTHLNLNDFSNFISNDEEDPCLNCNMKMVMDNDKLQYFTYKLINEDIKTTRYIQEEIESICKTNSITQNQMYECIMNNNSIDIEITDKLIKMHGRKYISRYKLVMALNRINLINRTNASNCATPQANKNIENSISGEKINAQKIQQEICKKIDYGSTKKKQNDIYSDTLDIEAQVSNMLSQANPDITNLHQYKDMLLGKIDKLEMTIKSLDIDDDDSLSNQCLSENDLPTNIHSVQQKYDYIEEIQPNAHKALSEEINSISDNIINGIISEALEDCLCSA